MKRLAFSSAFQKLLYFAGFVALTIVMVLLCSHVAEAASTGGGLPYEPGLKKVVSSVTGPVAYSAGSIGIVATMIVLWQRHSDMGAIGWSIGGVVMLLCLGGMAAKFITSVGVGAVVESGRQREAVEQLCGVGISLDRVASVIEPEVVV